MYALGPFSQKQSHMVYATCTGVFTSSTVLSLGKKGEDDQPTYCVVVTANKLKVGCEVCL